MYTLRSASVLQYGPPDQSMGMRDFYMILVVLIVVFFVIILLFFPRLEKVKTTESLQQEVERQQAETEKMKEVAQGDRTVRSRSIDVAIRMLEPDERRVVEALMGAGGTMLQKDLSRELGLSRVKTHRVLVRLLRRGVVTAEKHYNTNRIELVDWLKQDS
jgi:uncharacterized membrane protein